MGHERDCLGIIETRGLSAALEAADAMLKPGRVCLVGLYPLGDAWLAVVVAGETGPVQAAVEEGAACARRKGEVLGRNVIPRCDNDLTRCLAALCRHPASPEDQGAATSAHSISAPVEGRTSKNALDE